MSLAFSLLRAIKTYGTENLFHTYFSEYYFLHNSVILSDVFIHFLFFITKTAAYKIPTQDTSVILLKAQDEKHNWEF